MRNPRRRRDTARRARLGGWHRRPRRLDVRTRRREVAPGVGFRAPPPTSMSKLRVLSEFWRFLRVRKKFWLAPIVLVLVLLGLLVVSVGGSPLAPFVYALF